MGLRLLLLLPVPPQLLSLLLLVLLALVMMLTAPAAAEVEKKRWLVGGIFKNDSRRSPEFAAFNLAFDQLHLEDGWFSHLRPQYQYEKSFQFIEDLEDSFQISSAICNLVSKGAVVIFGPVHYKTLPMVQSITETFKVTYITISFVNQMKADEVVLSRRSSLRRGEPVGSYMIRLRPVLTNAVIDFIDHENWERFFFLYDSKSALLRLRAIFEASSGKDTSISADIRDLTDGDKSATEVLRYIDQKSSETLKRVFLDLTDRTMQQRMFEQIQAIRSSREKYHYLILGSDMNEVNLTFFRHGGVNITGFSLLNESNPRLEDFKENVWFSKGRMMNRATDLDAVDTSHKILPLKAALMMDGFEAFLRAHAATPPGRSARQRDVSGPCVPDVRPVFAAENLTAAFKGEGRGFNGITGRVQFDQLGHRDQYRVQVIEAGVKMDLLPISEWSASDGLQITRNLTELRQRGLRLPISNKTRIVTSILGPPFLMHRGNRSFDGTPLVGNDRFEGFCADLIKMLAKEIGFDYIIKPVADDKYGDDNDNGTWNGMIGELYRNDADIAVAPLTITSKREKVVDFSKPYMEVGLSIMFLKPSKPTSDKFGFMKPLSKEIWMCIAFAYLGVSVVLFVVSRFSPYEWHLNQESDEGDKVINDFSIFNSLWFALSAFMQQGGDISPRSLSGRIVGSVWWFFTLIIVSSYTANLAAFLTVERMSTPIQSYEDLAKQTEIKYGVLDSGSSKEFFRESKIQDFRRMWQFMEANPNVFVKSTKEGVERVLNSNQDYAFLLESTMNEYYSKHNCKTMKVGGNLDSGRGYGVATPAGSDLREQIDLKVLQLKEKSEISSLKSYWWNQKKCDKEEKDDNKAAAQSLELSSVMGLFYILVVGIIFGVLLSIFEFVYRCALLAKRKKRKFKEVFHEMLILSIRGRIVVDYSTENTDLIDNGVSRRFLK